MRISRSLATCAFLAATFAASTSEAQFSVRKPSVEDFHLDLRVNAWREEPDLVIKSGLNGTDVNLSTLFAFEQKWVPQVDATIKLGRKQKLRLGYMALDYDKSTTLSDTFTFGGTTYAVNVPATAAFTWAETRLGYEYDFVSTPRGFFGFIAEAKLNQVKATLSSPLAGTSVTDTMAPIPALGGIARVYAVPNRFAITAEFTGIKVPKQDTFEGKLTNIDIYGTIRAGRHVGIDVGYRTFDVDYLVDADSGTFKIKGPYLGGSVRF